MALDQDYFDSIHIDVVKKKYYNANKVEAVFDDIRRQAQALTEENAELRRRLKELDEPRREMTDTLYSAQNVYRAIVDGANQRAGAIVEQAKQERLAILDENQRQKDYSVQVVGRCLQRVREQQEASLATLNAAWQDFLIGLYPEDAAQENGGAASEGEAPPDLSEKVDAIVRALFSAES